MWAWTKTEPARRLFHWCRLIHVYLSIFFLTLLIFFCVTGIFLNHPDWFHDKDRYDQVQHKLPETFALNLTANRNPSIPKLEEYIFSISGYRHPRNVDIDYEQGEIILDYPLPNGFATAVVLVDTGSVIIEKQTGSMINLMNNLHKGRHSGRVWSMLIDLSGLFISFMSLAGLVILLQKKSWRLPGLLLITLGTLIPWLVYAFWVPK
ncbi:MAG: hypothetical protein CSA81_11260 [Acidobacteria bacterium]|nr:MAG: hypothetical protein CSA81_11260 [Acidobacteriota bacterium]PIE89953.1 MAG: hypothetical protein CR997_08220 [Acidobacteriota bacterium]